MGKFTSYPNTGTFDDDDVMLKDGTNGTKTMYARNILRGLTKTATGAYARRNAYFAQDLGSEVTSAMVDEIFNGTFRGLTIGSYFTFEDYTYVIADMDYYYGIYEDRRSLFAPVENPPSDPIPALGHHLVMMVRSCVTDSLPTAPMNDTDITTGGYPESKMYTEYLDDIRTAIETSFGELVIPFTQLYPTSGNVGSYYTYVTDTVHLMNENNVYGHTSFGPNGTYTYDNKQYAIFALNPAYHNSRAFWLRDFSSIDSSHKFVFHENSGVLSDAPASTPGELIVAFLIGQSTKE